MEKLTMGRIMLISSLFVFIVGIGACAEQVEVDKQQKEHKLLPGDKIQVRIPTETVLSGEYEVMANGKFYFPVLEGFDIGAVEVQGLTVSEVEEKLHNLLSKYYTDPTVTVEILQYGVPLGAAVSIYAIGGPSGTFRYKDGMRILDLIIEAGSFNANANLHKVALYRGDEITYYDISDLVQGRDFKNNFLLREGDYLIVPSIVEHTLMKVIVLGKVGAPGSYTLPEGSQVLDAIAAAGGTEGRAAVGKTIVIRVEGDKPVIINTDIKAVIKNAKMAENLKLRDGDVIFVPETERLDTRQLITDLINLSLLKRVIIEQF